ncbi:metallophosphoesterase [Williamsia sp. Leaf354]|uniref:metallophosphoesterase n=1 Tax=Williamsia sp. Leaf354 TaxID=1736349 RepID=UPI0006F8E022|nr:metallophosphoesterase [Williamsia sp. Leaf354]KQS00859.1 metallophosphoesterase [Williamsia sp. Leaf354]
MSNLPIVGILLALITVVLHLRFVRTTRLSRRAAIGADVLLVVAGVLALIGFGSGSAFDPAWSRWPAFVGWTWMAVVLYLLLGTIVLGVVTLGVRLGHVARGRESSAIRLRANRIGSAVVVVASVAAVGYGLVEAAHPRITRTTVALDRLPTAFTGTTVALVSDLHAGPSRGVGFVREVVDRINSERPDMVILDGDLIDGTVEHVGSDLTPLRDLSAPLGVFAVSGNHEFYADDGGRWLDLWDSLGVDVLRNERTTVTRDGAQIDVAGINDATAPRPYEPDLGAALAGRDPNRFVLLLAHQPLQAREASEAGVDMQVSGHTHAGQIWPLRYLVPLQQPTVEGLDTVGDTTIYTTRGAGAWGPPVRVGAPPEISMLELTPA